MPYTVSATNTDATGMHILGGEHVVTLEKISDSSTQPYIAMGLGSGAFMVDLIGGDLWSGPRPSLSPSSAVPVLPAPQSNG